MKGISSVVKLRIDEIIDAMFDRMSISLTGARPDLYNSKNIIAGAAQDDTLIHLFVQSLGNRKPLPKEEDVLKGLLHNTNNYIDALKHKTKAEILQSIDSFVVDTRKKGEEPAMSDVKKIIDEKLGKAKNHFKLISQAEATRVRNTGRYLNIKQANPTVDDPTVVFITVKDNLTCKYCKETFLMPDGITPRAFKMSEISSDYFDRKNPRPCLGGCHPHCFTENQRIQTDLGTLPIKTLFDLNVSPKFSVDLRVERGDGIQIFTPHNFGSTAYSGTRIYDTGIRPCIRFTFTNGAQLEVSEDHEMWIKTTGGFNKTKAKDAGIGNLVPLHSGEGLFGEGSFEEYANQLGESLSRLDISSIPDIVWSMNKNSVKMFIQGFFDKNVQIVNGIGLVYFSHNLNLLRQLNIALSMFGIPSNVNLKENETNLNIYGKQAVELFMQKIGLSNSLKAKQVFNGLPVLPDFKMTFETGIISVEKIGMAQTYSTTVPVVNTVTANGIVTGNCRCSMVPVSRGWGYEGGKLKFFSKDFDFYKNQKEGK